MFKRRIGWLMSNSIFAACLYLGMVEGVAGAANVAVFYAWLRLVAAAVMQGDEAKEKARSGGRVVPAWLGCILGAAYVCLLVWGGCLVTGMATVVQMVLVQIVYTPPADMTGE